MNQKDKLEIEELFRSFLIEMNEWEKKCNLIAQNVELTAEEKFLKKKDELIGVFDVFCTTKDRKNGKPNTISYGGEDFYHYDFNKEKIERLENDEKNSQKVFVYTFREDPMDERFVYIFIKNRGKWLIDSKKRYSSWKKKWENVSL
ncbi:hypothetical protein HW49_03420 [Porphyromonadaceae bacterium COT-184 OH4590]|nr:hypothetical protein HW49_03420 [Porphyromonadaceae bacterium COT-184 OH4590]MDO4727168.1 NTF2 fold immunity protein [Porphyromonadaceae bacterium]